ncbi:hypothetical protein WJX84_008790 [Apatococcus fuscideae]|uniref:Uncharacterized protein n=1 Tax=Apatococcus fuscideae TaxID=2026836 RepID=A0AAW1T4N5_9CHLO
MRPGHLRLWHFLKLSLRRTSVSSGAHASTWVPAASANLVAQRSAVAASQATSALFQGTLCFAAAAVIGSTVMASWQPAHCIEDKLEPGVLKELAHDLSSSLNADRERAVSMLSSLTPFLEHHEAMLHAGVLPCLMQAVEDQEMVPQVRVLALCCAADLMKDSAAHEETVHSQSFLSVVMAALQSEGTWGEGPEDGLMARSHASRLLSELCSDGRCHPILIREGAAGLLVKRGAELAVEGEKAGSRYTSLSAAPANMNTILSVEEERYLSASLFGLASSTSGRDALATAEAKIIKGMALWTHSRDPILQRYGAIGRIAEMGGEAALTIGKHGAAIALTSMLTQKQEGQSDGVHRGVQRCAIRSMHACSRCPPLRQGLLASQANLALQELLSQPGLSQELQQMVQATLQQLA